MKHLQTKSRQKPQDRTTSMQVKRKKDQSCSYKVTQFWFMWILVEPLHLNIQRRWVSAGRKARARNEVTSVHVMQKKWIFRTGLTEKRSTWGCSIHGAWDVEVGKGKRCGRSWWLQGTGGGAGEVSSSMQDFAKQVLKTWNTKPRKIHINQQLL